MVFFIIPKCPNCNTSKYVVMEIADVKDRKTWFEIVYCTKCYEVIQCQFRGRILNKGEHSINALKKSRNNKNGK
jgi:hypothetical protein